MTDANFLSGSNGLIAVDKVSNQVLFLDPRTATRPCSHLMASLPVATSC